jgi:signal transduction histidine kinase
LKLTFAGRLMLLWILTIGGSLALLTFCIAGLLFFSVVQSFNARISATLERAPGMLQAYNVPRDPDAAVRAIAAYMDSSIGLRVTAFNSQVHVIASPTSPESAVGKTSIERVPNDRMGPVTRNSGEQLAVGLATAFGMQPRTFSFQGVNFDVRADPGLLAWTVQRYSLALAGMLVVIGMFAFIAAKKISDETLRPIEEVVDALEAFGSGDLTPRHVDAAAKDEFGRITVAYNRAVEQVTAAFDGRDRAEAEMRRFIADAAHQLRTPLTVIQGFIGILLKNGIGAQTDRERILRSMDTQSRSMGSLIEKLTLLDRWEAALTNPQLIDIGDCIAGVIEPLTVAFPDRSISFSQDHACYAFVDSAEIREAFGNVLDNAVKYGAQSPVSVTVRRENGEVHVTVADGGPGFSDEERAHAFERFYRGEQRGVVGSGLGLAIAKRAIERAGGSISLESARPSGTVVTIELPSRTL